MRVNGRESAVWRMVDAGAEGLFNYKNVVMEET